MVIELVRAACSLLPVRGIAARANHAAIALELSLQQCHHHKRYS